MKEKDIQLVEELCARIVYWKESARELESELIQAYTVSSEREDEIAKLTHTIETLKLQQLTRGDR